MQRMLNPLLACAFAAAAGSAAADKITLYQDDNYGGRQITSDRAVANFDRSGFNDRIRSAVVHDGRWEICIDAEFSGGCGILGPGAYPSLGAYADRISSIRPVDGRYADNRADPRYDNRADPRYDNRNDPRYDSRGAATTEARATLYEGSNLSGRSYRMGETMRNLDNTGFNDRASSLRVDSGYWIFCSDAEFRGDCRTFGPGEYASLSGLNNVISSGRQISSSYPYDTKPDWQRSSPRPTQGYQSR